MPLLWDQPYQFWDSGITWDAGDGPSPGDLAPYLAKITSAHNQKPQFMAMMSGYLQPLADAIYTANNLYQTFDIDTAVGAQLDTVGLWVGRTRYLTTPITGVFFQFDDGPGFDDGIFIAEFDSGSELVVLPDEQYRTLLKATIAANHWDGTVVGAYNAYSIVFGPGGFTLTITDYQDMSIDLTLGGPPPDALTRALFVGGYLSLRPDGVRVRNYIVASDP